MSDVAASPYNVLFICSRNSARSLMAEALLRREGGDRFRAYSAGIEAGDGPHPMAVRALHDAGIDTDDLSSKSMDVFQAAGAPTFGFVFTVCDWSQEQCPAWPGQPVNGHWNLPDPAKAEGNEAERSLAFINVMKAIERRVGLLAALPVDSLDAASLRQKVERIDEEATVTEAT